MLVVRADANAEIGVGHAMRSLALAQAWMESGGQVTFAMADVPDGVALRIERAGARVERVGGPVDAADAARRLGAERLVLDGYHLGAEHQRALAEVAPLLVIDDEGETATDAATAVLNQNPYAAQEMYRHLGSRPELLLGTRYTLLRPEFRRAAEEPSARSLPAERLRALVSLGGADPKNLTPAIVDALSSRGDVEITVVVGAANPRVAELRRLERDRVRVLVGVEAMAALMSAMDVAVVAAGSTCWELACVGVPMLVVATAENQRAVARAVESLGIGRSLGTAEDVTAARVIEGLRAIADDGETYARMRAHGREIFDGLGAARVCEALRAVRARGERGGRS